MMDFQTYFECLIFVSWEPTAVSAGGNRNGRATFLVKKNNSGCFLAIKLTCKNETVMCVCGRCLKHLFMASLKKETIQFSQQQWSSMKSNLDSCERCEGCRWRGFVLNVLFYYERTTLYSVELLSGIGLNCFNSLKCHFSLIQSFHGKKTHWNPKCLISKSRGRLLELLYMIERHNFMNFITATQLHYRSKSKYFEVT